MNIQERVVNFISKVFPKERKTSSLKRKPLKLFFISYPLAVFFILDITLVYALIVSLGKLKYEPIDYQKKTVNEMFLNYKHIRTQNVFVYSESVTCNRIIMEMYEENIKYARLDAPLTMTILMQLCLLLDSPHTNSIGSLSNFNLKGPGCYLTRWLDKVDSLRETSGSKQSNYNDQIINFLAMSTSSQLNLTDLHNTFEVFEEKILTFFTSTDNEPIWQMSHQLHEALKKIELNAELSEKLLKQYISIEENDFYQANQYFKADFTSILELLQGLKKEVELANMTKQITPVHINLCQNIIDQFPVYYGELSKSMTEFSDKYIVTCDGVCCSSTNDYVENFFTELLRELFESLRLERIMDVNSEKITKKSSRVVIKVGETLIAGSSSHGSIFGNLLPIPYRKGFLNNLGEFNDVSKLYPYLDVPHIIQAPNEDKYVFLGNGGSFHRSKDILRLTHFFMQHFIFGNSIFNTFQCIEQKNLLADTLKQVMDEKSIETDIFDNLPDDGVLIRFSKNSGY